MYILFRKIQVMKKIPQVGSKLSFEVHYNHPIKGIIFTHFPAHDRAKILSLPNSVFRSFAVEISPSLSGNLAHFVKFYCRDGTDHKHKALADLLKGIDDLGYPIGWKDYEEGWGCTIKVDGTVTTNWELDDGMS